MHFPGCGAVLCGELCYTWESCAIGRAYLKLQLQASVTHALVEFILCYRVYILEHAPVHTPNSYYAVECILEDVVLGIHIKCYPVYVVYTCILFNMLSYILGMLVCS